MQILKGVICERREEQEEKVRILTEEIRILRKQVWNPDLLPFTLEHKESDLRWQIEKMVYDEMINHVWSWGYLGPLPFILEHKESGLRWRIEMMEKTTREEIARDNIRCLLN